MKQSSEASLWIDVGANGQDIDLWTAAKDRNLKLSAYTDTEGFIQLCNTFLGVTQSKQTQLDTVRSHLEGPTDERADQWLMGYQQKVLAEISF